MLEKNNETIKKALKCCASNDEMQCWLCPYIHNPDGCLSLPADALNLINEYEEYIKQLEIDKKGLATSYANAVARNLTLRERIEELEKQAK